MATRRERGAGPRPGPRLPLPVAGSAPGLPVLLIAAATGSASAVALPVAAVCLAPGLGLGGGRVVHGSWDLTTATGCLLLCRRPLPTRCAPRRGPPSCSCPPCSSSRLGPLSTP